MLYLPSPALRSLAKNCRRVFVCSPPAPPSSRLLTQLLRPIMRPEAPVTTSSFYEAPLWFLPCELSVFEERSSQAGRSATHE